MAGRSHQASFKVEEEREKEEELLRHKGEQAGESMKEAGERIRSKADEL